jgi:hypothetical protein
MNTTLGPWLRGDYLDAGILALLIIWFTLDRLNCYFFDLWQVFRRWLYILNIFTSRPWDENGRRPL